MEGRFRNNRGFTLMELGIVVVAGGLSVAAIAGVGLLGHAGYKYLTRPDAKTENVICGPAAEEYIERDGKRFYFSIDQKAVDSNLERPLCDYQTN